MSASHHVPSTFTPSDKPGGLNIQAGQVVALLKKAAALYRKRFGYGKHLNPRDLNPSTEVIETIIRDFPEYLGYASDLQMEAYMGVISIDNGEVWLGRWETGSDRFHWNPNMLDDPDFSFNYIPRG